MYWLLILSVTVFSFTIQPWSPEIWGMPIHVATTALLYILLIFINPVIFRKSFGLFTKFQWGLLFVIYASICFSIIRGDVQLLRLQQAVIGLMLAIISAAAMMDTRGRKYLLVSLALAAIASGGVAILQYLGMGGWSWAKTIYYGYSRKVPSGLEFFPVSYAYSVIAIGVIGFISPWVKTQKRMGISLLPFMFGLSTFIFVIAGLLLSKSRSGVLGIFVGIFILTWGGEYLKIRVFKFWQLTAGVIFLISLALVLDLSFIADFQNKSLEAGDGDMRLGDTWGIFLPAIIKYPLGISADLYNSASTTMNYSDPRFMDIKKLLLQTNGYAPHNILLTTGLFFGLPVVIALLLFYMSIFRLSFKEIKRYSKKDKGRAYIILIMLASNAGLIVHAWFHNANIFYGEMRGWIWIGALMSVVRFYQIEDTVIEKNNTTEKVTTDKIACHFISDLNKTPTLMKTKNVTTLTRYK